MKVSKHQPYGNVKMKGKKTKKLSCTCCVAINKKKYSDPVKVCEVYNQIGCAHVDGYHCDPDDCDIRKKYVASGEEE